MDDRYQNQSRLVQAYRWLRWRPWYALLASLCVAHWLFSGAKLPVDVYGASWLPNRRVYVAHIWMIFRSYANMRMGHWYTTEEVLNEI